jgi:LacI family transcriptional regulator
MSSTIRDVARRAGVSAMTVSRVINGSNHVSHETQQRVERAITELGYVPNSLARDLSRQKSGSIALIVPDVANPFFTLIVRGAEAVARRNGYRVILCNTANDLAKERDYLQDMLSHRVEGILIAPVNDQSQQQLRMVEQQDVPCVLLDRAVPGCSYDLVQGDSIGGAQRLVEHLIALSHRRIALLIGPPTVSTSRDRLRGYRQALAAAGYAWDDQLIVETAATDVAAGYRGAQQLLQRREQPSAIFAVNNLVALGVIQALRERGIAIPQHIALACFDDIEQAAIIAPFLTVMAQPAETFGTIATQLLLDRIMGYAPEQRRVVVLPAELVVRESCGAQRLAGQPV